MEKIFLLQKSFLQPYKAVCQTQTNKGSQTSEKLLLRVQNQRNWWKLRYLCLQQDKMDTQDSVLATLPTGFPRNTRNFHRLKCVKVKRRFQTEVPLKNLCLCTRNSYLKNLLETIFSRSENFCAKSGKIEELKTFEENFLEFIICIGWVHFWRLCWKLSCKNLDASLPKVENDLN